MSRVPYQRTARAFVAFALVGSITTTAAAQPDVEQQTARMIADLGLREAATPLSASPGWSAPRRVVVRDLTEERKTWLQAVAPGVELVDVDARAGSREVLATADAILGSCEEALLSAAPKVRWVQTYNAGVERCLTSPIIRDRGILLTNMQRIAGPVMAEHVIALVLAFARGLPGYVAAQQQERWNWSGVDMNRGASTPGAFALTGKTMLVVGFGGVGSEVARRAHALGMTVLAVRNRQADVPPFVTRMGLTADLPAFLAEADVVANTLPLTTETRGLFDARLFSAMKRHAFFVNVGRGATVVTADLVAALKTGTIAGAGLDVVDPEPLPPGHPLWAMPGVIITPHVSADSDIDEGYRWLLVRENLRRFVAGGRMLSVVDPARGY